MTTGDLLAATSRMTVGAWALSLLIGLTFAESFMRPNIVRIRSYEKRTSLCGFAGRDPGAGPQPSQSRNIGPCPAFFIQGRYRRRIAMADQVPMTSMPADATRSMFLVASGFGIGVIAAVGAFVFLVGIGDIG